MAAPPCMSDDGRPAVFVGTMLQTGEAFTLCDECLVMWSAALLQQMTGVDSSPFIAAISDDVPTTSEGAPTDEPPAPAPADDDRPTPSRTRAAGRGRITSLGPGTENGQEDREPEASPSEDAGAAA